MPIDPRYTHAPWCAEEATKFIRQNRPFQPWLMSVNIVQPHRSFLPSEEYLSYYDSERMPDPNHTEGELNDKPAFQYIDHNGAYGGTNISFAGESPLERRNTTAAYYAMIEQVNTAVDERLGTLEEAGQGDNTIVIFMSDHGEMLGDHGIYLKGPYFYDCLRCVLLMIRWLKRYRAGLTVDALVDRGIDDGAGRDAQAFACQVMVHRVQNLAAQFMLLQKATEAKDRGLIRSGSTARSTP